MYRTHVLRNGQTWIHSGYLLNSLVRSGTSDYSKWDEVLRRVKENPHEIKSSSGKEVALSLHGLSRSPLNFQSPIFSDILVGMMNRAIKLMRYSMNEKSIAIAALALVKLNDKVPQGLLMDFCTNMDDLLSRRIPKHPQNISQLAYSLSCYNGIPIGFKADAMNTWIRDACISQAKRFHVPDIVQVLVAYANCHVLNEQVLKEMETAVSNQLQYMDHRSLSSICHSFSKLGYTPNQEVINAITATSVQCLDEMNTQSICCTLSGLSFWISEGRSIDLGSVKSILARVPLIMKSVPVYALGPLLRSVMSISIKSPDLDIQSLKRALSDNISDICSRTGRDTRENAKLMVDTISSVAAMDEISGQFMVKELILPALNDGASSLRKRAVMLPLAMPVLSESQILEFVKTGPLYDIRNVRLVIKILLAAGSETLVDEIVRRLIEIPNWNEELSPEQFALISKHVWRWTGSVNQSISQYISDPTLLVWLKSDPIELGRFELLSLGSAHPTRANILSPPPDFDLSITTDDDRKDQLARLIREIDPVVNLSNVEFHFIAGTEPSPGELSVSVSSGAPDGTVRIFIPKSFSVDTSLAIQVLNIVFR